MDDLSTSELLYCLIEDIEDYTMHVKDDDLDAIVETLEKIKSHCDRNRVTEKDLNLLTIIKIHFLNNPNAEVVSNTLNFKQFAEDTKTIIERIEACKKNK